MGNENSKSCLSCTNERFLLDCSPPPTVQQQTWSNNHDAPNPGSHSNITKTNPVNSLLTSITVSDASSIGSDDVDDVLPKRPCLKNNNSSSENMSCQLSALVEDTNETTELNHLDANENEYVDVPPIVADIVRPENARKNVMDKFEVIQTLGDGMSSCVFEVRHTITGQRYALKRLRRAQNHADLLFVGECKFLNVLQCQGVIRTVDAFVDENFFYVLNELGVIDLFKKIKANQRLSEQVAKQVVRHLLETLKELHHHNMAHRDIKPENVVFTDKESNFPKVIDFGDAIMIKENKVYTELVGTQCYLAPERWRPHHGWELKAADIWAIGVLTYEMVTGKRCFYGSSDRDLVRKIQKGHYKYPDNLEVSNLCCHFIRSLLTVKSKHRPTAEFALRHPWLADCDNFQARSLIESWNFNVTSAPDWTVYKPNFTKKISA